MYNINVIGEGKNRQKNLVCMLVGLFFYSHFTFFLFFFLAWFSSCMMYVRTHCSCKNPRKPTFGQHASSNSSLPVAWITGPATDPSLYLQGWKTGYLNEICNDEVESKSLKSLKVSWGFNLPNKYDELWNFHVGIK